MYTHTRLTARLFRDYPGEPVPEQGLNWGGSRRIADPAPLIWDPLPLITDPAPHNWDPVPFCWDQHSAQFIFEYFSVYA